MKKTIIIVSIIVVLALAAGAVYFFAIVPAQSYIGRDAAKTVALEDMDISENDTKKLDVDFEKDDGYTFYEVNFTYDKNEYEYSIDAFNGEILNIEKEPVFDNNYNHKN